MHHGKFSHLAEVEARRPQQRVDAKRLSAMSQGVTQENVFLGLLRHNLRKIQAEKGVIKGGTIDPSRTHLNTILRGASTVPEINQELWGAIKAEAIKVRSNACIAFELLISLPAGCITDEDIYFGESLEWAESYFATKSFHALIHRDEAAPHMHVLMMPIRHGKLVAGKLIEKGKDWGAMRDSHFDAVAERFGLQRQTDAIREAQASKASDPTDEGDNVTAGLVAALEAYVRAPAPVEIVSQSMRLLAILRSGIDLPSGDAELAEREAGSFGDISIINAQPLIGDLSAFSEAGCIKTANPYPVYRGSATTEPDKPSAPVGTCAADSFVDDTEVTASLAGPADKDAPPHRDDYVREREYENPSELWDNEVGEWIRNPVQRPSTKLQAAASVAFALRSMRPGTDWSIR